eukprot:gnl/Dysnectes_brevis/914_a1015_2597.p1 GENE.gnl/Dysnectes_brevis/914_a1015_2597~~gnl/Dysnectes_brevis/914_a1015_2597.p1  ORF type:complete len:444 (-),score=146.35 gnl/Dysnectes_brevis/914_a1015_2597:25-1356(-)
MSSRGQSPSRGRGSRSRGSRSSSKGTQYHYNPSHVSETTVQMTVAHTDVYVFAGALNDENAARFVSAVPSSGPVIVGFDAEWKPEFRKGQNNKFALFQLCYQNQVFLYHIPAAGCPLPACLRGLFHEDRVKIYGKGVSLDKKKWPLTFDIPCPEILDIHTPINELGIPLNFDYTIPILLDTHPVLAKEKKISRSNWAKWPLAHKQVLYSSFDVWATYAIAVAAIRDAVPCPICKETVPRGAYRAHLDEHMATLLSITDADGTALSIREAAVKLEMPVSQLMSVPVKAECPTCMAQISSITKLGLHWLIEHRSEGGMQVLEPRWATEAGHLAKGMTLCVPKSPALMRAVSVPGSIESVTEMACRRSFKASGPIDRVLSKPENFNLSTLSVCTQCGTLLMGGKKASHLTSRHLKSRQMLHLPLFLDLPKEGQIPCLKVLQKYVKK